MKVVRYRFTDVVTVGLRLPVGLLRAFLRFVTAHTTPFSCLPHTLPAVLAYVHHDFLPHYLGVDLALLLVTTPLPFVRALL